MDIKTFRARNVVWQLADDVPKPSNGKQIYIIKIFCCSSIALASSPAMLND